jgi:hypothetical protein
MRKKIWEYIKKNIPAVIHFIVLEIVGNLIWNFISMGFSLVIVREIGFLVIVVMGMWVVAWYLPKLSLKQYSFGLSVKKRIVIPRTVYDGVQWENHGMNYLGYINVEGPLCPKDSTPLIIRKNNKYETSFSNTQIISKNTPLICLKCKTEYLLGDAVVKSIEESRKEVGTLFESDNKSQNDYVDIKAKS